MKNLYQYENKKFSMSNKALVKEFTKDYKKFEMDIAQEVEFDLVEDQFDHKNKLFDKKLKYKQSYDNKEIDYAADKRAKRVEIESEEGGKAIARGVDKALQGNKEVDRFGRKSPSLAELIDQGLWKQAVPAIVNYKMAKTGAIVGGIGGGVIFLTWYAPGIAKDYIIKTFINPRPTILLPGSKIGRWDRFARWKNGYKSPEMIFATEVSERLTDLVNITDMIKKDIKAGLKRTYRNVMLWGPPGTGKTLFANVLADKLDMDFCAITAGSLLQKDVGIQFLNDFERMARKSRYGMILFIDEADALFVDRNTLNIASEQGLEHYKV
ncbi:MAG TPA: AAA family ATPase, partial [Patescibacteria group bacterium]|nr:AAA family ATPase [Patescibacteria group bacterium]